MRFRARLLLAGLAICAASAEAKPQSIVPPEIADGIWWSSLGNFEPPIWRMEDRRGFRSRLRFSIFGISTTRAAIRIDEDLHGRFTGHLLIVRRAGRSSEKVIRRRFHPSQGEMTILGGRIAEAKLWTVYPERWVTDEICVDGEEMTFERSDADGYGFSQANAQCDAPPKLLEVAQMMMELAGESRLTGLLAR